MLQKIQLLVAGGKGKIVTSGPFAAFLCAKGRIGEHQIIAFHILACGGQGVGKQNFPFNTVQHGVHQGQTVRVVHQLAAGEGFTFLEGRLILVQIKILVGLPFQVLIRRDHKTKGAAGRVVTVFADLGLHETNHHINEHPWCEILACAGFLLIGVLFQQTFIEVAEALFLRGIPVQSIDARDDLFQIFGLVDVGYRSLIDLSHPPRAVFAQLGQHLLVNVFQLNAAFGGQHVPAAGFGNGRFRAGFLGHFQEQNIGQFRHILMIGDAVIPQDIAEVPEFGDNFLCGYAARPPSSYR